MLCLAYLHSNVRLLLAALTYRWTASSKGGIMGFNYRAIVKAITPPIIIYEYKKLKERLKEITGHRRDHRRWVGGAWEEIGQLQFNFLLDNGLLPHHKLLDIGCGSLRGGVHLVKYLNDGNYYGIDGEQWLLDAAREIELSQYGLSDKTVHLICRDDFDFSVFGVEFDYAIAQSVFTHLTWNSIQRCLVNVEKVLKKDGKLCATFFEDKEGNHRIDSMTHTLGRRTTYPDKDPYHYEFDVFAELAKRVSLEAKYIGEWDHPRGQMMMIFAKPDHDVF